MIVKLRVDGIGPQLVVYDRDGNMVLSVRRMNDVHAYVDSWEGQFETWDMDEEHDPDAPVSGIELADKLLQVLGD